MIKEIFLDTDVILDVAFKREPHFVYSQTLMSLVERNIFSGFTSSLIIANCYYIISSNKDDAIALKTILKLRSILKILPFTDREIGESLSSDIKDFEDGIQYFICINNHIGNLVTRNIADYKNLDINVLTPKDFLNLEEVSRIIEGKGNNKRNP
ncbi:MAG: PIN domain-containing protein [Actinomycetia bacterium]|nr:PIN domain-containing protein [Actinomycetes bacterium]